MPVHEGEDLAALAAVEKRFQVIGQCDWPKAEDGVRAVGEVASAMVSSLAWECSWATRLAGKKGVSAAALARSAWTGGWPGPSASRQDSGEGTREALDCVGDHWQSVRRKAGRIAIGVKDHAVHLRGEAVDHAVEHGLPGERDHCLVAPAHPPRQAPGQDKAASGEGLVHAGERKLRNTNRARPITAMKLALIVNRLWKTKALSGFASR
jgi:hypothetical protein